MAIHFNLIGSINNSNNVVISSHGKYGGKPEGYYQVIDADCVGEYISKRNSIEKKEKALDLGLGLGALGLAVYTLEKFKYGGRVGKVLSALAAGLTGIGLTFKLSNSFRNSQIRKLDNNMGVQHADVITLSEDPDFIAVDIVGRIR